MKVPLLDLKAGYRPLKSEIEAAVRQTMDEQSFIMGSRVEAFEKAIAVYVGVPGAVSCASGSDALLLALMALGVGPECEVVTTPFSFFATAGCIARLGAIPVFVDIEPDTFNIDVSKVEAAITPRTRAVVPVHLFGQCADIDTLASICERHGLPVVEDAAQALGARWAGRSAGSFGAVGCFSFYPSKNLGGFGDGGMMTTSDPQLDQKLRALRTHGGTHKYHYEYVGMNSRLDALQAAILSVKLPYLERWHAARKHNAFRYHALFREAGLTEILSLPAEKTCARHVYNQFVIRAPVRDGLQSFLRSREIGTEIYYPLSLHKQKCFAYLRHKQGDFPNAENAESTVLGLPIYPELTDDQLKYVVSNIAEFYECGPGV